jgi:hypothetical protein
VFELIFTTVLLKIQFFVDLEDRDKTALRNVGKYLSVDEAKYPRRHGNTTAHTLVCRVLCVTLPFIYRV